MEKEKVYYKIARGESIYFNFSNIAFDCSRVAISAFNVFLCNMTISNLTLEESTKTHLLFVGKSNVLRHSGLIVSLRLHFQDLRQVQLGKVQFLVSLCDLDVEVNGRKFGSNDDGAPLLVS